MQFNLAQINIGKISAPMHSPVMAGFAENLDSINALAENSAGFVWRLREDNNNATSLKIFDDEFIITNMSVWTDADTLFNYVYKTAHAEYVKRRKEWFEKMAERYMALWYVPATHIPTTAEAVERLMYLRQHGETPYAFSFKKQFTAAQMLAFAPAALPG